MENLKKNKTKNTKKRQHCQFNTCNCPLYIGEKDSRCEFCGHGDVWHKLAYSKSYFQKEDKFKDCLDECPN